MAPVFDAQILSIQGTSTRIITLKLPSNYSFKAGQYLHVITPNGNVPLSIASSPHRLPIAELHYRSTPGLPEAMALDKVLQTPQLQVSEPAGEVQADTVTGPLLVVAGGTGAAQAFALAEYRSTQPDPGACTILWCADSPQDVYEVNRLSAYANSQLVVKVDNQRTPQNEGMVWLKQNAATFGTAAVILCGSPSFVYAATDVLLDAGLSEHQCQADVYSYAPRLS